jgi:type I restriction enzyme S subunit
MLPPKTVLLTSRAPVGYLAISKGDLTTNQGFRSLIIKDGFCPEFIYYLLLQNVDKLKRHASGSTFQELSGGTLKDLEFDIPERITEQRAIAHILGSLDDKIELNRRMNETLEAIARTLFKSWFVDFDPVVYNAVQAGNPVPERFSQAAARYRNGAPCPVPDELAALFPDSFENSELGEIPKGWEVGTLKEFAKLKTQSVNPSIKPDKIWEHYSIPAFDSGKLPVQESGNDIKSGKYMVPRNSVLVSKLNPQFPRIWLVDVWDTDSSICSTEFMPFKPLVEGWLSYLYEMLKSQRIQTEIINRVTGSTGSRQRVKPKDIAILPCLVPPKKLINFFCARVGPLHDNLLSNIRQSATLVFLRDTLLPKLISGELRVPDAAKFVEEVGI